jgi:hypothetical protein
VADSVWSCKKEFGSACKGLPADKKHEGKQYCVLHFPSVDKDLAVFEGAIEKKLKDKDFDFRGVYFPGKQSLASFLPNATFEGTVDFYEATFEEGGRVLQDHLQGAGEFLVFTDILANIPRFSLSCNRKAGEILLPLYTVAS